MSHQKDTDYLALSSRIHAMENRLLTRERMERMLEAKEPGEAAKVLAECGYGELVEQNAGGLEQLLSKARNDLFRELEQALPQKSVMQVFQLKFDYHNMKVLLKMQALGKGQPEPLLLTGGRYDPAVLLERYRREELGDVSPVLRKAVMEAKETLSATGDPQRADFRLDRAYYEEMANLAEETGSELLRGYVRLVVDAANLRCVVRAARLEKGGDFLSLALVPGGTVSQQALVSIRGEELAGLFQTGPLAVAAALGSRLLHAEDGPLTEFERLCDDALMEYLSAARRVPFGVETVIGYLYAREVEATIIRTILSGRMAGLAGETIRGRLRSAYV